MKHLKTYENAINNKKYEIGDYMLINIPYDYSGNQEYTDFINNNIGKLIKIWSIEAHRVGEKGDEKGLVYYIELKYTNIPKNLKYMFLDTDDEEKDCMKRTTDKYLVDFSSKKEDIEALLVANKYNL